MREAPGRLIDGTDPLVPIAPQELPAQYGVGAARAGLVDVSQLGEGVGESPSGAAVLLERDRGGATLRRVVDIVVVLAVAPVVVPLVLLLGLVVRLDSSGPAFWLQQRPGFAGDRFRIYKLRTMYADADERKKELLARSVVPWPDFKVPDDPRVTRLGRVLRRTSLDELPQLWNVLRGDLTLVGPRACSLRLEHYELWQTERLEAKPGLFGRWQAEGRAQVNFDDRCRMDIRQIRSQGVMAELRLTFKSLVAVVRQRGAS